MDVDLYARTPDYKQFTRYLMTIENDNLFRRNERKNLNPEYFQQVPNILINEVRDQNLTPTDVCVYIVFCDFQRGNVYCFPSLKTVAKHLGLSSRTVSRSVSRLLNRGHIKRRVLQTGKRADTCVKTLVKDGKVESGRVE